MSTEAEYKAAVKQLSDATDEVKKFADTMRAEVKNIGEATAETKASADKALAEMNALSARVTEMEQKAARSGQPTHDAGQQTLGSQILARDEVKSFLKHGTSARGSVTVEAKTILSASGGTGASGSTGLVQADRQPGIIQLVPNQALTIRDLLMPGTTSSSVIDYPLETVFTNNATETAEGAQANESDIKFDLKKMPVAEIRHFVRAGKSILADAPGLQSYINGRLIYGLRLREDKQFLNGDGTGSNILGLMNQSTAYAAPAGANVANATIIDTLRLAILQAVLAGYPATGHILSPVDWTNIELTKDGQSRYIFANPSGISGKVLWGLPVAESLSMAPGNFMTGAFKYAAQVFDREDATITISTEDANNATSGIVSIIAEERVALVVYRPQALIKGTFAAPSHK